MGCRLNSAPHKLCVCILLLFFNGPSFLDSVALPGFSDEEPRRHRDCAPGASFSELTSKISLAGFGFCAEGAPRGGMAAWRPPRHKIQSRRRGISAGRPKSSFVGGQCGRRWAFRLRIAKPKTETQPKWLRPQTTQGKQIPSLREGHSEAVSGPFLISRPAPTNLTQAWLAHLCGLPITWRIKSLKRK